MLGFLLFYLVVCGGLSSYLYRTIVSGIGHDSWQVAAGLVALGVSPLVLRAIEGRGKSWFSGLLGWVAYHWLGVAFIFAGVAGVVDLGQLVVPSWSDAQAFPWVVGLVLAVSGYGFWEARRVKVRRVKVRSPKLRMEEAFRVVQISDVHLGFATSFRQIRKVMEQVRALSPDLVVSSGDLFDSDLGNLGGYVDLLKGLEPRQGKLAVTGNHEVYAGLDEALAMTRAAGFVVLRGAAAEVVPGLWVAGVDDPEVLGRTSMEEADRLALDGVPEGAFAMLLKHRPVISKGTVERVDLQLSGHTHGGQIFPFLYLTRLQYRVRHGLSKVAAASYLYLSRGTGSWGPKIRVGAPPEISVFEVSHGKVLEVTG